MDGSFGKTGMLCYLFLSALLSPSFFLWSNEVEARRTAKTDDPVICLPERHVWSFQPLLNILVCSESVLEASETSVKGSHGDCRHVLN